MELLPRSLLVPVEFVFVTGTFFGFGGKGGGVLMQKKLYFSIETNDYYLLPPSTDNFLGGGCGLCPASSTFGSPSAAVFDGNIK